MDRYPARQQGQAKEDGKEGSGRDEQQRYPVPLQPTYQYEYKYRGVPNVVYGGSSRGYYVNEQDQLAKQSSGVVYPNVLPAMYHSDVLAQSSVPPQQQQQSYYQYPTNVTRTAPQFPPYQYYPVYPAVAGVQARDAAAQRSRQLVLLDNPNTSGMLPSLQIQQPLIQQTPGAHHLSLPFQPPHTQAGIAPADDPRLAYQPPLPLPSVAPSGWINDTNDNSRGDGSEAKIKDSTDRAEDIDNEEEDGDRKSGRRISDQGSIHKCHLCHKSFKRRSWLKRHLLSHFPDRHFACPWCLSKHKRKDNLLQHMKLKHTDYVLQELRLHNIKVDDGFLTVSNNNNGNNSSNSSSSTSASTSASNSSNNIRSLLYEGKLNKDEVKRVLNSLIDKHNNAHN